MEDKASSLGLEGYDPVRLCETGELKRGSLELKARVDGMTYFFTTAENRGRFQRNPDHFLPQFGGFCAFACGLYGGLVPGNVAFHRRVSGKVYLLSGPRALWAWEKFPGFIPRGHANYDKKFKIRIK